MNVSHDQMDRVDRALTCKGYHEEEITQFDGETLKKMMINEISTFLSHVHTKDGSDLGEEDEKNKREELKVIIVVEGDAEFIKKS